MDARVEIKHVLVAVDDTGLASHAIVRALRLADELDASVRGIHALQVAAPLWPGLSKSEFEAIHAEALANARRRALEVFEPACREAGFAGVPDDVLDVELGSPAKVILRAAAEQEADLIVIGPHAKRHLFDLGSTARAVLPRAEVPVWVQSDAPATIRTVLVPVDFSAHSKRALEYGCALADVSGASVKVLHCHPTPALAYSQVAPDAAPIYLVERAREAARAELDELMATWSWGAVRSEAVFVEGNALPSLREHADAADLTVLGTHGRTRLSRFLIGSIAHGLVKSSKHAIVVVPAAGTDWELSETG